MVWQLGRAEGLGNHRARRAQRIPGAGAQRRHGHVRGQRVYLHAGDPDSGRQLAPFRPVGAHPDQRHDPRVAAVQEHRQLRPAVGRRHRAHLHDVSAPADLHADRPGPGPDRYRSGNALFAGLLRGRGRGHGAVPHPCLDPAHRVRGDAGDGTAERPGGRQSQAPRGRPDPGQTHRNTTIWPRPLVRAPTQRRSARTMVQGNGLRTSTTRKRRSTKRRKARRPQCWMWPGVLPRSLQ